MSISKTQVEFLLQGLQRSNPRLYDTFRALLSYVDAKGTDLENQIVALTPATNAQGVPLLAPADFAYTLPGNQLHLQWSESLGAAQYEVRVGAAWATASLVVRTNSLVANLDPIVTGSYTYWIAAMSSSGVYSTPASLIVTISNPSGVTVTPVIIDNNVLLYWTAPVTKSFNVAYYNVYQDGDLIGTLNGTFTIIFVNLAGTYTFNVKAVDIAGNIGPDSTAVSTIDQPPDFALIDTITSTFAGSKTDCIAADSKLYAPIIPETYEEHFVNNSWVSIQDQVDAVYPLYIQPGHVTATYVEDFDFLISYAAIIVNVAYSIEQFASDLVNVVCSIQTSADGITWSTPVIGLMAAGLDTRYVRVTLTFTGANTKAICAISNLQCLLEVKYRVDSGSILAVATDAGGTIVTLNTAFKDVNSITVSLEDTVAGYAIYDFVDIPNPTHFHVLAFDTSGNQVTKTLSWKARGII